MDIVHIRKLTDEKRVEKPGPKEEIREEVAPEGFQRVQYAARQHQGEHE